MDTNTTPTQALVWKNLGSSLEADTTDGYRYIVWRYYNNDKALYSAARYHVDPDTARLEEDRRIDTGVDNALLAMAECESYENYLIARRPTTRPSDIDSDIDLMAAFVTLIHHGDSGMQQVGGTRIDVTPFGDELVAYMRDPRTGRTYEVKTSDITDVLANAEQAS